MKLAPVLGVLDEIRTRMEEDRASLMVFHQDLLTAIQIMAKNIDEANRRAEKMADRLIEMSLVNAGAYREAVAKGKQPPVLATSATQQSDDDWEKSEDEEWPPKGYVSMNAP